MKAGAKFAAVLAGAGLVLGLSGFLYLTNRVRPMPAGAEKFVRYTGTFTADQVLEDLRSKGVVADPRAAKLYLALTGKSLKVRTGTFRVRPGMTIEEVRASLAKPVQQMVRLPEGFWIARTAPRLEKAMVCLASEYIELARQPEKFQDVVSFELPKDSLEGYLYPDTYDLPPLLGAEATIRRQLKAFEEKVVSKIGKDDDLHRAVIVGSMIELEAALDEERPVVAGVIENRLKQRMRLQLDATVLYALQKWFNLGPGVVNTVKSPYNTYLNSGLPPGPIGSPGAASILASLKPKSHDKLFYVARPNRTHIFAATYDQHLKNIRIARAEWKIHRAAQEAEKK